MRGWFGLISMGVILIPMLIAAEPHSAADEQTIAAARHSYGVRAGVRTTNWRDLVARGKRESWHESQALAEVNRFFNRLQFIDDYSLWGMNDYWAVPLEFLGAAAGDCEDYSIAKYFTLLELGIPDAKMRMVYVKALSYQQFHMVVAYYPSPAAVPLILDNIDGVIKPATKRRDLVPVFSFNGSHLWLMKARGQGQLAGSSSRLKLWTDLQSRFSGQKLKQPKLHLDD